MDTNPDWGQPLTKTITYWDPLALAGRIATLSGLEVFQAMERGEIPPPPIARLMGFGPSRVVEGEVTFTCLPDQSTYNPIGVVHGGLVSTLLDTVTACAVHTTLAVGVAYTSIDLQVQFLRPVLSTTGEISATGRVTKRGRRVSFARGEVVDAQGQLLATATTTCLIMQPGT